MAKFVPTLMPWDYWRLTPAELADLLAGGVWRHEQELERVAWHVMHMLNVSGKMLKQPVSVDKLLGRKERHEARDPVADFEALWARHVERMREQGLEPPVEE